jgi:hypothetical protein
MVWVSNRDSTSILVSVTNVHGGSADFFRIATQPESPENTKQNFWPRSGDEFVTIKRGDKEQDFQVGAEDFVRVYSNAVIVSQATVLAFEKASLEWCRGNSKVWENPVRENTTHYTVGYTCKVVLRSYLALGCEVTLSVILPA